MKIEELIIDGFKSYPQRTQITQWDSSFNAITGLNGSGKSNILDAICFVLGMTNMQTMRASTQADLIYKRGQAGVTRASVTIVFDNSAGLHDGFKPDDYKQITVTRQFSLPNNTKWLFNGHKSTQQFVLSFFQAVGLNINNPNFLIMQGRITKVLNMRPAEILGMIEEAAGTRMFEEKKDKARRTMTKKQNRVNEVSELIETEIKPKLNKLRAEKKVYVEYTKSKTELEKIGRVLRAWEYTDALTKAGEKEAELEQVSEDAQKCEGEKKKATKECHQAEKDYADVAKRRDAEMKKGGKLTKLKEQAEALGKEAVKVRTQAQLKQQTIADEEKGAEKLQAEITALEQTIANDTERLTQLTASHKADKDQYVALETDVQKAEELLQTLLTGVSSNKDNNTGGGYMGRIAEARSQMATGQSEEEQARRKLGMRQQELEGLKKKMKEVEREAGDSKKKVNEMKAAVDALRNRLGKSKWSQEKEDELEARLKNLKQSVRELTDRRERLVHSMSRLNFEYSDPSPNFDRSKIKGFVAQNTALDKKNYNKATALEVAAGGKLFNLIVEDDQVGNSLLKNGRLRKRVTMIPLNKIKSYPLDQRKINTAQSIAPQKVWPAISLVGYPDELAKAMLFVFGSTFICEDAATAKAVTFNKNILTRSVTLDGDVYDPQGSLSGGSAPSGNKVLIEVQALLECEFELRDKTKELAQAQKEEASVQRIRDEWNALVREEEIRSHELRLLEEQVGGSNAARIAADVAEAERNIQTFKDDLQAAKEKQENARAECAKLEKDMSEFKNNKSGKIDELKKEISKKKAALQKHTVTVKSQQKEHQTASLELDQLRRDLEAEQANLEEARKNISGLKKELVRMMDEVTTMEARVDEAERKLKEEQATLGRFDSELKLLDEVIKARKSTITDCDLQLENLKHKVSAVEKERKRLMTRAEDLEKGHDWIKHDKELFGKPDTQYDFSKLDIHSLQSKATEIEKSQEASKKRLNPKAADKVDGLEKREAETQKMLKQVLDDKGKIEKTIEELDRHKREALQKTWEKVTADFGSIFNELLPGNTAKLQPPEGQDLTQGLEVKVRLGQVWKQSLTELSGGQRSLIALSLIMALLQFKPAPMYILDEIDAALDLSHTQNIGQLFRTRFKGSQFIVVSLKEGLFTNANVLFKAKFRDGTSVVERTGQRSGSSLYH